MVHLAWWETWVSWIEHGEPATVPPVENTPLLDPAGQSKKLTVRPGLRQYDDYVLIPGSVWRMIKDRHGGGPSVPHGAVLAVRSKALAVPEEEIGTPTSSASEATEELGLPEEVLSSQVLEAMFTPLGPVSSPMGGVIGLQGSAQPETATKAAVKARRRQRRQRQAEQAAVQALEEAGRPRGMCVVKPPRAACHEGLSLATGGDTLATVVQCLAVLGPLLSHMLHRRIHTSSTSPLSDALGAFLGCMYREGQSAAMGSEDLVEAVLKAAPQLGGYSTRHIEAAEVADAMLSALCFEARAQQAAALRSSDGVSGHSMVLEAGHIANLLSGEKMVTSRGDDSDTEPEAGPVRLFHTIAVPLADLLQRTVSSTAQLM